MSTTTGDLIRKYRKQKGLTQKKLGDLCGIADSNIRKYETGRQKPKIETIEKIAEALDVHPLVLIGRISEESVTQQSIHITPVEVFAALFNYMYGNCEIQKNTKDNVDSLNINYILGTDEKFTISDLTYDNTCESIERIVRMSINCALKYNSQEPFSLLYDLENADLQTLKMIHEYANFLIYQKNQNSACPEG